MTFIGYCSTVFLRVHPEGEKMSDVVIRPAMPADLPDLRMAMVELQEHETRLDATTRLPGDHIPESADSNRFGYLSDICVMPAYRRQRIAQRLLTALEQHLASAGITRFRLFALAANASARATYESVGFAAYEILYEKLVDRRKAAHP